MSNKSNGNKFEEDFAQYSSKCGYWCHLVAGGNYTGSQPGDLILAKNNIIRLIDCKVLSNKTGRFDLSRLEENQRLAFKRFKECGNNNYFLMVLWNNDVYEIKLNNEIIEKKSINVQDYEKIVENFYED